MFKECRCIFRNWIRDEEAIINAHNERQLDRFKPRESSRPELDSLLYDWFIDSQKPYPYLHISRQSIITKPTEPNGILFQTQQIPCEETLNKPAAPPPSDGSYEIRSSDTLHTQATYELTQDPSDPDVRIEMGGRLRLPLSIPYFSF